MGEFKDDRSPGVKAYAMASQVIAVAGMMVVPGLLGLGLDQWLVRFSRLLVLAWG